MFRQSYLLSSIIIIISASLVFFLLNSGSSPTPESQSFPKDGGGVPNKIANRSVLFSQYLEFVRQAKQPIHPNSSLIMNNLTAITEYHPSYKSLEYLQQTFGFCPPDDGNVNDCSNVIVNNDSNDNNNDDGDDDKNNNKNQKQLFPGAQEEDYDDREQRYVLVANFHRKTDRYSASWSSRSAYSLQRDLWVTIAPELHDFCSNYLRDLNSENNLGALRLRTEQLLGLPPDSGYTHVVELWVRLPLSPQCPRLPPPFFF